MAVFSVIVVVLPVLMLLVIGVIVLVLVRSAQRRPVRTGSGGWNAEVLGSGPLGALGGTLASTFGTFAFEGGTLSFVPDGTQVPAWQVPCAQLGVRRRGPISLDGADVELDGPMGRLRCNVSTEHINRMTRNNFKDMRERGYAAQFVAVLEANGARIIS